ncbi:beta-mannosidase [Caproicibacter sp.]|uniref:beta-mannosidase n=1 Tax=Caproicibacter sp. TaxID=2814884 RepID=UPI003988AD2B
MTLMFFLSRIQNEGIGGGNMVLDLNGSWRMRRVGQPEWRNARVPGSVCSDLLDAGLIKDPFYGTNESDTLNIFDGDFEYRRSFLVDEELLRHDRVQLCCEGLDTLCTLSVNDCLLANTDNMHRTYEFDCKKMLRLGENIIDVIFHSPTRFVAEKQREQPLRNSEEAYSGGISHLRKAHYMFGWDWGPMIPDMGIWRNIMLIGRDHAYIRDYSVSQVHQSSSVALNISVSLEKWAGDDFQVKAVLTSPEGSILAKRTVSLGESNSIPLSVKEPRLWWPNGYGEQPLYRVSLFLYEEKRKLGEKEFRLGLRTLKLVRERDQWGTSFAFEINGVRIFAMGADYIPEDNLLSRRNRARTEKLIRSCVRANFNMIRVWGGGIYPDDYFYELCDRYGLLVWQDFMFACGVYDFDEKFRDSVRHELEDNIKRIRGHASLALWCGNNEMEWMWVQNWKNETSLKRYRMEYQEQFEKSLPEFVSRLDPDTPYWPSSPSSGGDFHNPNDENRGDMHDWDVWHGKKPFTDYRSVIPRFMSEFGLQSFPSLKTVKTFASSEEWNIFSRVMESHQKSGTGNEKILYYISQYFRYPGNFDSLLYLSQLIQAEGIRYGVEHWRRSRGRCMGVIYWQLNDCWPVASWSGIDGCGRWKALHYTVKRCFAPVLASACEEGTRVSLHVSNESKTSVTGCLEWKLMTPDSAVLESGEMTVCSEPLSSKQCASLDFSRQFTTEEKKYDVYLEYLFSVGGKRVSGGTVLFCKAKHFHFHNPAIKTDITEKEGRFFIRLRADAFAKFVELDLKHCDAVFSDNYFDLSAHTDRIIALKKTELDVPLNSARLAEELSVRSVYDTYEKF